jgi:hypothetical protein
LHNSQQNVLKIVASNACGDPLAQINYENISTVIRANANIVYAITGSLIFLLSSSLLMVVVLPFLFCLDGGVERMKRTWKIAPKELAQMMKLAKLLL